LIQDFEKLRPQAVKKNANSEYCWGCDGRAKLDGELRQTQCQKHKKRNQHIKIPFVIFDLPEPMPEVFSFTFSIPEAEETMVPRMLFV